MAKRKIAVVTGTRAEYGLLFWLLKAIKNDPDLELQIITTGMHLSPEFGLTYKTIENDGFAIADKIEMLLSSDTPVGIAKSVGLATIGFADTLERLQPDVLVVLGDRFEILAAAQAAVIHQIPLAHIHGGELTEGLIDDPIRHSVTKMAHFHFTTTDVYRKRVIQMGEQPDVVFNVGAPGLDNIKNLELLSREAFEESIDFKLGEKNFLVTYHPVTLSEQSPEIAMSQMLLALDEFPQAKVIFTLPNSDTFGRVLIQMIKDYVAKNPERCKDFVSLGQLRYLSAIKHCDLVLGNSSSGLIEVPSFRKPTIDLGERQRGRLKGESVISATEEKGQIVKAIQLALSEEFRSKLPNMDLLYGYGDAGAKIKETLKKISLDGVIMKKFKDLDFAV
ncbi:MAG: UDP-N-acetylglucosamine 2-epimerase (hydrolyzing) [Deltaproteobacteria bacterium]|nr:UDP-N-acetylglucosamine 2-epimerase (hydrolyzing) [Deltaproteobacteria bacterium]